MRSRISLKRVSNSVPWLAISSAFQPPPMPNMKRPPDSWSSVATCLAVWIGIALDDQADAGGELDALGHHRGGGQRHERIEVSCSTRAARGRRPRATCG